MLPRDECIWVERLKDSGDQVVAAEYIISCIYLELYRTC